MSAGGPSEESLPESVRAHLDAHDRSFLLTLRADGSPTAHPMTALVHDGALAFNTYRKSAKARNVVRDPRLAAVLLDGYAPRDLSLVTGYAIEGEGQVEVATEVVERRGAGRRVSEDQKQRVAERLAEGKRILIRTRATATRPLGFRHAP